MAEIRIRDMVPGDRDSFYAALGDLQSIHYKAMPDIFRPSIPSPPEDAFEQELHRQNSQFFAAEIDGEFAGFCVANIHDRKDNPTYPLYGRKVFHLEDLYVCPEFRRMGVATALYEEAQRRAKEAGADKIELMVWDFNESALELYKKLGFRKLFVQMENDV